MNIEDYLRSLDVAFEVKHHATSFTAQREAAAQHISGKQFAKTVVVKTGDRHTLLVLPAARHVDLQRVGELLGGPAVLAEEREMAELFPGCDVGAEPPFGSRYGLPTLVDRTLAAQPTIAVRAGSHTEVLLLAWADYQRLEQPEIADFSLSGG